jgi:hypothetical protein
MEEIRQYMFEPVVEGGRADADNEEEPSEDEGDEGNALEVRPDWCTCAHCQLMGSEREYLLSGYHGL